MSRTEAKQTDSEKENSHWLNRKRLRVYPRIFLSVYIFMGVAWWLISSDGVDLRGKPLGADFITFWSASYLALSGSPLAAFDAVAIFKAQQLAVPASETLFLWHHPPTFMALIYPLALLPYITAYFVFMGLTLALFVWVMLRLAPTPYTLMLTLAFGGTLVNFLHGQTGFLLTALLGGALMCLKKRPFIAAILIAVMSIKPHFGILIPIALACGGYWRVFFYTVVTTLTFWLLCTLLLGAELWVAGIEDLATIRYAMDVGALPWAKMPSIYATFMMFGGSTTLAYGAQALSALVVASAVAWAWRGSATLAAKGAVLVCGVVLIPPYIFDYDLTLLAIPIALLAQEGLRTGWRSYEREILVIAGLAPMVGPAVADNFGFPLTLFLVVPLFFIALRRAMSVGEAVSSDGNQAFNPARE